MRRTGLLGCLLLGALVTVTFGRVAPPLPAPKKEVAKAPPKPNLRLQKLQQLTFDRRPSTILKTWAPEVPMDPKELAKQDALALEMTMFQRRVTLGQWDAVKDYLAVLPKDDAKAGYEQMLRSLQMHPMMQQQGGGRGGPMMMMGGNPQMMQFAEKHQIGADDVVGLAWCAPQPLTRENLDTLGGLLSNCLQGGTVVEAVVARFKEELKKPKPALTDRQIARMLANAGQAADVGAFLPTEAKARADKDLEALNLLVRHYLAKYEQDKKLSWMEQGWSALQAVLAAEATAKELSEQEDALKLAVDLAPKLKKELGEKWLEESFTKEASRGMTILATIGSLSSQGLMMNMHSPDQRLKTLKLQKTAVEALLKASPQLAKKWGSTLTLLARNWLRESEITYQYAQESSMRMRRDRYGNMYWNYSDDYFSGRYNFRNPNQPQPIDTAEMLQGRPSKAWLEQVDSEVKPKLAMLLCQLHLKANEEKEAFPHIETLAMTHPRQARELTNEYLRVWTKNHDPNAAREYTNPYMWMYGYDMRSSGIPLTRSKQERNIVELAECVTKLKKLPIGEIDEELLAKAFTSCHSSAEVYRTEAIEKVFGPMGGLKPKVLSGLAQQMRENLATVWRRPEEQKDKKTNRKTKDIQQEVQRGYAVALETVDTAMKKFPDDWSLMLARAALKHDEVNFEQELGKSTTFTPKRLAAFKEFEQAAKLYAAKVKDLQEDEQSTKVFEQWMYAALGAVDLNQVNEEKVPDWNQPAKIKAALVSLPGDMATKHLEKFANNLFTHMSQARAQIKYNYLKAGFDIVGDTPHAVEAKKVFDYYRDLVNEIKLETRVDGSTAVGHGQPFGVFVLIRHTRDIERESGGFGRYLQNQNTGTSWSYNYGRPTADYRDRFQTTATEALKENFEVLSVTFETDKVHSRAVKEYGWRVTPYAYLLLKARGPQVDKLPPLRLDLDFLDTSGYVVLPIETPALPIDARAEKQEARPVTKYEITQVLDERQAGQGKLIVEVKASGRGLVPNLTDVVTLDTEGFKVVKTQDQGVSVGKFDEDSEAIAVRSDRSWLVYLEARDDLATLPTKFTFGTPRDADAKMTYQRYDDADLATVPQSVELERSYGKRSWAWLWGAGTGVAGVLGAVALTVWAVLSRKPKEQGKWQLPEPLTPFTAIALLERIEKEGGLTEPQRRELGQSIRRLERHYFAATNGDAVDLRQVTEGWMQKAK